MKNQYDNKCTLFINNVPSHSKDTIISTFSMQLRLTNLDSICFIVASVGFSD